MTDQGTIWLTQEAYDKLQAELDDLKGPRRQEIIEKIAAARDEGDLKENSGYHAAKDDQGKQEARIRQLEDMLRRAEVGETPADDGVVEPGMVVTVDFGGGDEEKFLLGSPENLSDGVTLHEHQLDLVLQYDLIHWLSTLFSQFQPRSMASFTCAICLASVFLFR